MNKKILYIVLKYSENNMNDATLNSIKNNLGKMDAYVSINYNDKKELYYNLKQEVNQIINNVYLFDFICLIPDGSILNKYANLIFKDYYKNNDENEYNIYLPFVFTMIGDNPLILNKHIWNSYICDNAGFLDLKTSLKQIDSTIFGSYIPVKLFFDNNNYNDDLLYYQQYYFLNSIVSDENNTVIGIPKIILTVNNWDYKLNDISNDEKIINFNLAKEKWINEKKK